MIYHWRSAPTLKHRCRWPQPTQVWQTPGYRVYPYLIARVENLKGETVYAAKPHTVCAQCRTETGRTDPHHEAGTLEELLEGDVSSPSQQPALPVAERIIEPRVALHYGLHAP